MCEQSNYETNWQQATEARNTLELRHKHLLASDIIRKADPANALPACIKCTVQCLRGELCTELCKLLTIHCLSEDLLPL